MERIVLCKPSLSGLIPGLLLLLAWLPGCDSNGNHNSGLPVTPTATPQTSVDDGSLLTVVDAMQEPRLTFNNPWTAQQLDDLKINSVPATYHGPPFTTWKNDYEQKRLECTAYSGQQVNGETVCLPSKEATFDCSAGLILEYGYYCGSGRPAEGFWGKEPLDGVDHCCYVHDLNVWGPSPTSPNNACGAVMCLYYATEYPAGAVQAFPEVENARQCIYDWAKTICLGNQSQDAPVPATKINP